MLPSGDARIIRVDSRSCVEKEGLYLDMNSLLIASLGFTLFILCPRMAGMANVIANATNGWISRETC